MRMLMGLYFSGGLGVLINCICSNNSSLYSDSARIVNVWCLKVCPSHLTKKALIDQCSCAERKHDGDSASAWKNTAHVK